MERASFVTTMCGISGHFAVLMHWNTEEEDIAEGFWEPWQTGFGRYETKEEAEIEAQGWAEAEEIQYGYKEPEVCDG